MSFASLAIIHQFFFVIRNINTSTISAELCNPPTSQLKYELKINTDMLTVYVAYTRAPQVPVTEDVD